MDRLCYSPVPSTRLTYQTLRYLDSWLPVVRYPSITEILSQVMLDIKKFDLIWFDFAELWRWELFTGHQRRLNRRQSAWLRACWQRMRDWLATGSVGAGSGSHVTPAALVTGSQRPLTAGRTSAQSHKLRLVSASAPLHRTTSYSIGSDVSSRGYSTAWKYSRLQHIHTNPPRPAPSSTHKHHCSQRNHLLAITRNKTQHINI